MLAVLHLPSRASRLLLLYLRTLVLLLHFHHLPLVDIYTLPAYVEVALPAVVKLIGIFAAEMALSFTLEGC